MDFRERIVAFVNDMLARTPVELTSKLAPTEVLRRLEAGVDSDWAFGGGKDVVGRVAADSLRLRMRISYRNSFQTFLFGAVRADGRGTRIVARTGAHPAAAVFATLWIAVVGIGAAIAVTGVIWGAPGDPALWLIVLVPVGMFAFGIALVMAGRWFARDERARLIAFLERTAEGRRAS
jgi:hypothetical protein